MMAALLTLLVLSAMATTEEFLDMTVKNNKTLTIKILVTVLLFITVIIIYYK